MATCEMKYLLLCLIELVTLSDATAPTATCPGDQSEVANLDSNTKAISNWSRPASCSDNSGENITPSCTHQSGDKFHLGQETVTCTCTDTSGNTNRCSFVIIVTDATAPTATCPGDQFEVANQDSNTAAISNWSAPASCSDNSGETISPSCNHQSGDTLHLGNETVICTCTDSSGNANQCSFVITVTDATPPTATCPRDQNEVANQDSNTKAISNWSPLASCSDNSRETITPSCTHQSGEKFNFGNETVTCTSTDSSGNANQCSFVITVTDATAPTASCPGDQSEVANLDSNTKAISNWSAPASCSDNSGETITPSCTHHSGDTFHLGNETVICTCTDSSGNANQCSFVITVTGSHTGCREGYSHFQFSCYKYRTDFVTFQTAREICQNDGGDLTSITTAEENAFVGNFSRGQRSWIGGVRSTPDALTTSFRWVSGEQWEFTSWRRGQPNNRRGREHCIEINLVQQGRWNDHFCRREKPYICEIPML